MVRSSAFGWDRWPWLLGTAAGAFLGLVLLVAAASKAIDPAALVEQIRSEGLGTLLPPRAVAFVALGLELALGSALILGLRRWWVLLPTAALAAFFLFLTGRQYWRFSQGLVDPDSSCGCFGNLLTRTPAEAFWGDLFLLVPPLVLAFVGRSGGEGPPRRRLAAVAAVTAAGLAVAWQAPNLPLDDLATRLRPGVRIGELCAGAAGDGSRLCLDGLVPELEEGRHLVVITALETPAFLAAMDRLNARAVGGEVALWVVTAASPEELRAFRWQHGPAFGVREAPPGLLRPLYRTLPRSFAVDGGAVVATYSGLPPPEGA